MSQFGDFAMLCPPFPIITKSHSKIGKKKWERFVEKIVEGKKSTREL